MNYDFELNCYLPNASEPEVIKSICLLKEIETHLQPGDCFATRVCEYSSLIKALRESDWNFSHDAKAMDIDYLGSFYYESAILTFKKSNMIALLGYRQDKLNLTDYYLTLTLLAS